MNLKIKIKIFSNNEKIKPHNNIIFVYHILKNVSEYCQVRKNTEITLNKLNFGMC
jgi:hypothetical protein